MILPSTPGNTATVTFTFNAIQPSLQNSAAIALLNHHWFGENTAQMTGYVGSPIDWWWSPTTSSANPAVGDFVDALDPGDTQATSLRTRWLVVIASGCIRPWRDAATTLQTT